MKIGLIAHGYPPELIGGTENSVQALGRALAGLGHKVFVVAGSMDYQDGLRRSLAEDADPVSGRTLRVHRIHRADLFFDHWQKSASPAAGQLFEDILREESPDVINVHHWIRLSRDLVMRAALLDIPAVVTLHDLWTTCLISFRVRPDTKRFCTASLAPDPCAACAAILPPATPWLDPEELADRVTEFAQDTKRELELAAAVVAPSAGHVRTVAQYLDAPGVLGNVHVLPPARTPQLLSAQHAPLPEAGFTQASPLLLAHFGKWSELKGTDLLLEALALTRDPSRFRLLLAGDPSTPGFDGKLRAFAEHNLPADSVTFFGAYDSAQLSEHALSSAHLFVTGTRAHESFGLVVDEALELGMGCLLPNLGAMGERASKVAWATVFESGEAQSLADLLDEVCDSPERVAALREAAICAVLEEDFTARAASQDVLASSVLGVLEKAIQSGVPSAPLAALRQVDWAAREARLQNQNDAWDAALCSS